MRKGQIIYRGYRYVGAKRYKGKYRAYIMLSNGIESKIHTHETLTIKKLKSALIRILLMEAQNEVGSLVNDLCNLIKGE